jgi:hypothetical protein
LLGKRNRTDLEAGERERIRDREKRKTVRGRKKEVPTKIDCSRPYSGWVRWTRIHGS